jgi:hypothetical protein
VGAAIGGVMNLIMNAGNINNFWQGLGYFGIGAAAGALGAGVAGGLSSSLTVAAGTPGGFAAGFWGTTAATTATSSFASGALIGAGAGFSSGFTTGFGNGLMQGKNFGNALGQGGLYGLMGAGSGAAIGGLWGGIDAAIDGRRFWDGATVQRTTLAKQNIPVVGQIGTNDCGPASVEAVDRSFGGNLTQQDVRGWAGFEGDAPLGDGDVWKTYVNKSGHSLDFEPLSSAPSTKLYNVLSKMQGGSRIAINLNMGRDVGHSVVIQSITEKTITKINGTVLQKLFYNVMNPANGGSITRIPSSSITNSYNVFYISY